MWLQDSPRNSPRSTSSVVSPRPIKVAGAVIPHKYSALNGRGFSRFLYDSGSAGQQQQQQQAHGQLTTRPSPRNSAASPRQLTGLEDRQVFKHCSLPPAPKQAGAFQRFRYSPNPFEDMEDHKRQEMRQERAKTLAGAFAAGGNARDGKRSLKRRAPELKAAIQRTLRADWPSFVKVAIDERGVLLACFAVERLSSERRTDLHAYMNRLLNTHPASAEFGLNREPTRWGVVPTGPQYNPESNPAPVMYALRPPWVPNDLLNAHRLLEQPLAGAAAASE